MTWTRRRFVVRAAKAAALLPGYALVGCTAEDGDAATDGAGDSSSDGAGSSGEEGSSTSGAGEGTSAATTEPATTTGAADGSSSGVSSASSSSGGAESESTSGGAACERTPEDIEGPFYRPEIPIGSNLDLHGDDGVALRIEGQVLGEDCMPIAGAVVEIWHATPVAPKAEPGDVLATYDDTADYRYYGQVATAADGSYAFDTLRPGWYLNGADFRPAHIHVKVWVRGVERLTSQLYFEGDPFNDEDPWYNPVMALSPSGRGVASIDLVV
ncbi:MAG: hypothetical protein AAGA54_35075 [Myxococcota bacterium]